MNENTFRNDIRNQIIEQMKNSRYQSSAQIVKEYMLRAGKINDSAPIDIVDNMQHAQHANCYNAERYPQCKYVERDPNIAENNDDPLQINKLTADKVNDIDVVSRLRELKFSTMKGNEPCHTNDQSPNIKMENENKYYPSINYTPSKCNEYYHNNDHLQSYLSSIKKDNPNSDRVNNTESTHLLYETDSNIGARGIRGSRGLGYMQHLTALDNMERKRDYGCGASSDTRSEKSNKTVLSRSSQDLRRIVKSQCKLHEVIDHTLKQMCTTEKELTPSAIEQFLREHPSVKLPPELIKNCKCCCDNLLESSTKDISDGSDRKITVNLDDGISVSIDEVVTSKVINPMIRKIQRMYLNNLKEEMLLMEDLEGLTYKFNEVYKATLFKNKN